MLNHNTQTSQLTGNYDEDFPELSSISGRIGGSFIDLSHKKMPWEVRFVRKKGVSRPSDKITSDFCIVRPSDVEPESPLDVSDFEALDCPEDTEDWEMVEHPKPSSFELVHGGVSSKTIPVCKEKRKIVSPPDRNNKHL